mgnify:CR=1 FL=1
MTLLLAIYAFINVECYSIKNKDYHIVTFYIKFISEDLFIDYCNTNFSDLEDLFSDVLIKKGLYDYVIESLPTLYKDSDNINYECEIDFLVDC